MSQEEIIGLIQKYISPERRLFKILTHHSLSVAQKAIEVADKHPELPIDRSFLWEGAWLHDIGVFLCNAPSIDCLGNQPYIAHGYLGAELLMQEELPRHAGVAERHTGTGLSIEAIIERQLPIPHRDMRPRTLEEEIICYADKFFSKTRLDETKEVEQVRESLTKFGNESVEQFEKWHFRFN